MKVKIDSARRLFRCTCPIKVSIAFFSPDSQPHLKRSIATAIIINKIFERLWLCGKIINNQLFHGLAGTRQQLTAGLGIRLRSKTVAEFEHLRFTHPAPSNDRHQIPVVHLWRPRVAQNQIERCVIDIAFVVNFDRWNF